ncbi:MAG: alpha-2-macroglobulin [Chloroflexi bacterium]|nr:MAG: alpha-2-macroglobulin [Chloroflexota bacterium]
MPPVWYVILAGLVILLAACAGGNDGIAASGADQPPPTATPTATPTPPPPPPKVEYQPVSLNTVSPIVVQRYPRRGEELPPDAAIELVFDRPMDRDAVAAAFSLQKAAEPPQPVQGDISWTDPRTMRFTPAQPLERAAVYDAILTQTARAEDGAPLAEPFTFRFTTVGFLEVAQVIPADGTADVETAPTITVIFNRPVVPLTSLEQAKDLPNPLALDPPVEGQGEWLNTSIFVFRPDEALPGGVTFTARVKAGLTDVTGQAVLADDFTWRFTTQPPQVVHTQPKDASTLVPVDTAIRITFNQPVDPQSAQAAFELSKTGLLGQSVPGQFRVDGPTLVFTPTDRLEFDATYQVTIKAGVTSTAGGQGMPQPYSFRFTTVPLPRVVGTDPQDGERNAPPHTAFRILFNTPINPDTVMDHVEFTPPITPTQVYTYYSPWDSSFTIDFGAKPSTDYLVRITPGIEDPYGNKTRENLTVRFRTRALPPVFALRTPDIVATYDADLPARLLVGFINVTRLDLRLYRLDPRQVTTPPGNWYDFSPDSTALIRQWQERLEAPANQQSYHVLNLAEGDGRLEPGLYWLEADSPDLPQQRGRYNSRHLLVVSRLNLTLKAGEQEALVWATDLAGGEPVPGLDVTFFDDSGQRLGTATTDADGLARLALGPRPNRRTVLAAVLPTNGQPFAAVSENWARGISPYEFGVDTVYTLPRFAVHTYTDRPIYRPGQTVYFKGIVRSEDDASFRLPDRRVQVTVQNAAYETIFDQQVGLNANGTFKGQVDLPPDAPLGQYTLSVQVDDHYHQSFFQVAAYRPPEFETTVELSAAELRRGEDFSATINAAYFFGGPLANAPVTWNLVAESYRFDPPQLSGYTFTDSDDPYVCLRCWWYPQETVVETLLSGSGVTDAAGQLVVNLKGDEIEQKLAAGSYRLTLEATITGPDNQVISGRSSLVYHRGDYYIGLRAQEYVARAGRETGIDLVAVDWAGQRQPERKLDIQIVRYEWVNTFVETESGGYWEYQTQKELVDRQTVTTDANGEAEVRFTPSRGGSYRVIAQDAATLNTADPPVSPIRSSVFIWVAGDEYVSWRRENTNRLTLISDKVEYAPGETAEILIPSPFSGPQTALVTVERGHILQQEVIRLTGSSTVYRLPITEAHTPNIYLSVVLLQGREGPAEGDQPRLADFRLGILPIDVTLVRPRLKITLTPSVPQAEPGAEVDYLVQVTDVQGQPVAAELSLDLVDKAVLTLQPRQPEAIVDAFYGRRGLGINTALSLSLSMNQLLLQQVEDLNLETEVVAMAAEEGLAQAGPMPTAPPAPAMEAAPVEKMAVAEAPADEARAALPPGLEVREEFSDTAYWNPVVVTDDRGEAQVSLTLPDNLTTWVMRGVGVTGDTRVGEAEVELVSTKPLLIRPVTPRFLVVDDRAQVAANVSNNTDDPLTVQVTLAAEGVNLLDSAATQTVELAPRSEAGVTWNVQASDVPTVSLVFAAVSADGRYTDAAKPRLTTGPDGSLLVFRYTAPDIVGTGGQLTAAGSRTEVIALPPNVDTRRGSLDIQLDPSLAAGMRDGLRYLEHFEYECTEQTVSRFLPNVLTYDALQRLGIENKELADRLPGLLDEGLEKLYRRQNPDGGWGWWQAQESNVYISAYVVFALTRAQQAGVDVSATVLANGQNYLLSQLPGSFDLRRMDTYEANRYAWVLYVLAEGNTAPPSALAGLVEARSKLSHYARAYLALALHLSDPAAYEDEIATLLSDLQNAAILSATGAHWEESRPDWWAMNTDTRSTAIVLDALARLDPQNELIPNVVRWLMVARRGGIWETTQETAWALISLTDWMAQTGELQADYDYSVFLNEEELASGRATPETVQESVKLSVPIADLLTETGNLLTVARADGNGRLYYTAHASIYLPVEEIEPAERGIIVRREYRLQSCLDEQAGDKSVTCPEVREARLGDVIQVKLTIIAPNDLYYVVVEDPLPAGAEAIDPGLATTSLLESGPNLRREDSRYWWWWRWYSRYELRDEKVVLFADFLSKGTYQFTYTIRTTLPGDYHVIPTVAREFYFPEVFGRSDGRLLSIGGK